MQGAGHRTWSQVSRIRPWAEGGATPLSHQGCPIFLLFKEVLGISAKPTVIYTQFVVASTKWNSGTHKSDENWRIRQLSGAFLTSEYISNTDFRSYSFTQARIWFIGQPGCLSGLVLPSAQGLILETWDRVPRWAPFVEPASPLPVFLPTSLSLSLCVLNEWINK